MGDRNDNIGAFCLHLRYERTCGIHDVVGNDASFQVAQVPLHDLRRHKTNETNLDGVRAAVLGGECAINNNVLIEERNIVARVVVTVIMKYVGADVWEVCACNTLREKIQAVVELVITDVADGVIQKIHRFVYRVDIAFPETPLPGDEIAKWVALQKVTVIYKNAVADFRARLFKQRGGSGQAGRDGRLILKIVVIHDVHVDVAGLENSETNRCIRRR